MTEPTIEIRPVSSLTPDLLDLAGQAETEGHRFMRRLVNEWRSGANRFDQPGEVLLAAYAAAGPVGLGGLNRDPYAASTATGRLRHLYVAINARRGRVGSLLVRTLLGRARSHFAVVRLRTKTPEGPPFYARLGFETTDEDAATHRIRLDRCPLTSHPRGAARPGIRSCRARSRARP